MGFPCSLGSWLEATLLMVREHPRKQWPLPIPPPLPFCCLQRVTVCKGESGEDAHGLRMGWEPVVPLTCLIQKKVSVKLTDGYVAF